MLPRSFDRNPDTRPFREAVARINAEIENASASSLINESMIENWLRDIRNIAADHPGYWLLLVRLTEAALLCAGYYVDNGQFEAVGDLLVNPREIMVYSLADGSSTAKNRHRRLSEQFTLDGIQGRDWMRRFSTSTLLRTTKLPLIPHLAQVLGNSDRISPSYLGRLAERQHRIVATLTFLAAWPIHDSVELWRRLHDASEREFVESNLCRFNTQVFDQIGDCLKQSLADPYYQSPFLARARWFGNNAFEKVSANTSAISA